MNFTELNIRRPVMTTLVMAGIMLFGIMAYTLLPVSDLPNVDFPVIQVMAALPGAVPETMASSVATPLERQFSTIAGVDSMSSSNTQGLDDDRAPVQPEPQHRRGRPGRAGGHRQGPGPAAAGHAQPAELPEGEPGRPADPVYRADQPERAVAADRPARVGRHGDGPADRDGQRRGPGAGVRRQEAGGPGPARPQGAGQPIASASTRSPGRSRPATSTCRPARSTAVSRRSPSRPRASFSTAEDYLEPLIVAYRNNAPVYLRDIGTAIDSVETDKTAAWFGDRDGRAAVDRPGRAAAARHQHRRGRQRRSRQLLPIFQKQLPASVQLHVLYDRSESIQESVDDVQFTLVLTLGLVVMVIFLFIRNVSATVIPSLALPMSVVGTFTMMYLLGYSLDNLSLMALTLSVGFVVDDAIVMLENIVRHTDMGKSRMQAALDGAREIGFTILSMTLSLAAVFIPVLFMGGHRRPAVPRVLGHHRRGGAGLRLRVADADADAVQPVPAPARTRSTTGWPIASPRRSFNALLKVYEVTLRVRAAAPAHARCWSPWPCWSARATCSRWCPAEFMPSEDRAIVFAQTEGAQGDQLQVDDRAPGGVQPGPPGRPGLESFMSLARRPAAWASARRPTPASPSPVRRPHDAAGRDRSTRSSSDLRPKVGQHPRAEGVHENPAVAPGRRAADQGQVPVHPPGPGHPGTVPRVRAPCWTGSSKMDGFSDVNTDLQLKSPQVNVAIDREQAAKYGVTAAQIESAPLRRLRLAAGLDHLRGHQPVPRHHGAAAAIPGPTPTLLSMLYIRSNTGRLVPLNVRHPPGQRRRAAVGQPLRAVALGHAVLQPAPGHGGERRPASACEQLAAETLPATVTGGFQGQAQAFSRASRDWCCC